MSKPTLDSLEAVAIRNLLNIAVYTARTQAGQDKALNERITNLSKSYQDLSGKPYVYEDAWRKEID